MFCLWEGSCLVCGRDHVLFVLFVFPVSLDCSFVIVPSVFYNVYFKG